MTIQDLTNILTVMEEKSINKAATKLFTSQPSLSKCIKKVEQEYSITLFDRTKGSALALTEEGVLFIEMAKNMMEHHSLFERQLEQLRMRNENNIIMGTTMQRAYDLSGPIMRWIYENYPGIYMELRTLPSKQMIGELISGNIDIALIANTEENPELYLYPVSESGNFIYLRKGSPAAGKAKSVDGIKYPVLSLKDIAGELLVDNVPGTGGRKSTERIMQKNHLHFSITEQPNYSLRVAMADAGRASMLTGGDALARAGVLESNRIFAIPPEEEVKSTTYLVCRKGFENNRKFAIIKEATEKYFEKNKL